MDIITLLLTASALAADAFSVSVSSGIIIKPLKLFHSMKIAFFFGFFQFIMPCIGWLLGQGFISVIEKFAPYIAFFLLFFIGAKMLWEALHTKEEEVINPLDNKLLTILAVATSIDALAVGVTFAAMELELLSLLSHCAVIGIVTFIISAFGVYIGDKCGNIFGNKAEIAGGLVLIGIGAKILIQSLI